ncbi:MAG: hypothetical protein C0423_01865 [Methylibium sp.]|nr:hypothetical protein [Methylibium sp.]
MQPAGNPTMTTQAAIRELKPELVAMQKRGFTLAQIADALVSSGVNVAVSTLKTYMRRAGDSAKSKARGPRAQRPDSKAAAKVTTATTNQPKTPRGTFTARADTAEI